MLSSDSASIEATQTQETQPANGSDEVQEVEAHEGAGASERTLPDGETVTTDKYPLYVEFDAWRQEERTRDADALAGLATAAQVDEARRDLADRLTATTLDSKVLARQVAEAMPEASTVTIATAQYQELRNIITTQLMGTTVSVGLLALLLGVCAGMVITMHWRARA